MTFGMSSPQSNLTRMLDLSGSLQTSLVSVSSDRSNRLRFIFFRTAKASNATTSEQLDALKETVDTLQKEISEFENKKSKN